MTIKDKVINILGRDFTFDIHGIMEELKVRGFQTSLGTLYVDTGDDGHYWTYSVAIQDADDEMKVTGSAYDTDAITALCKAIIQTFTQDVEDADNEARADAMKL